jgi:putative cell wall-binding protein
MRIGRLGGSTSRTRAALAVAVTVALSAAGLTALRAGPAAAATAQVGNDISWPQCPSPLGYGNPMPADSTGFVVLGLTFGLPFTPNPCLADEARWVRDRAKPFHAYTIAAYPTADQLTQFGAKGPFPSDNPTDQVRNVGYAQAQDAVLTLRRIGLAPPLVWVDVEARKGQPWPTGTAAQPGNRAVLEGILAGLKAAGIESGFYANANDWNVITGNWQRPDVPFWATVGARDQATAQARCAAPGLDGGPVYQAQWWTTTPAVDYDLTCPGHELAAPNPTLSWPTVNGTGWSLTRPDGAPALAVSAGPSRSQAWTATVRDACSGTIVRTLSGTTSDLISVTWDGARDDGSPAPGGIYRLTLRTGAAPSTSAVSLSTRFLELVTWGSTLVGGCRVTRTAGTDVYGTAVEVGRASFPASRTVVLASGDAAHVVDAVTAAPYARTLRAPLLLTAVNTLPDVVTADLQRRGATQVIVVGGPSAVSTTVTDALGALGVRVTRVAGKDRYATAALLASRIGGAKREIVVASGVDPSLGDALLASGPAAGLGLPVLLTGPTSVPAVTLAALRGLGSTKATITLVGRTSTVSTGVQQVLRTRARTLRRVAGADPAATAVALARTYVVRLGAGGVVLVSSGAPVTTLAAAGLGRVMLLTGTSALLPATGSWLAGHPGTRVRVVAGPTLVTGDVVAQIGR